MQMEPKPICIREEEELSVEEAVKLLQNAEEVEVTHVPPVKPKEGEVYLFSPGKVLLGI